MIYNIDIHDRKRCKNCKKVMPKDHFIKEIDKSGNIYYRCSEVIKKKNEKKNNKIKTKWCDVCQTLFTLDHFIEHTFSTGRKHLKCKSNYLSPDFHIGSKKGKKHPRTKSLQYEFNSEDYHKDRYLDHRFGTNLDWFNNKLKEQNNCCGICGKHKNEFSKDLDVDHDHSTGELRGLLCSKCNKGLGLFKDNIKNMESSIKYLDYHEN